MMYKEISAALARHGLIARGGFIPGSDDAVPALPDGRPARGMVLAGNAGPAMWRAFFVGAASGGIMPKYIRVWTEVKTTQVACSPDATDGIERETVTHAKTADTLEEIRGEGDIYVLHPLTDTDRRTLKRLRA